MKRSKTDDETINRMKQTEVNSLLFQLNNCKVELKQSRNTETSNMNKAELYHHERMSSFYEKKRKVLINKLDSLGYKADRRGRPKKNEEDKYKTIHTRVTCYFTDSNNKYLKKLKEEGEIENISAFLNDLLVNYYTMNTE